MGACQYRLLDNTRAISILTPHFEVFMGVAMFSFLTRRSRIRARRRSAGTWDMR
jgi:hypothetical protein